jgi:hypothetical protein
MLPVPIKLVEEALSAVDDGAGAVHAATVERDTDSSASVTAGEALRLGVMFLAATQASLFAADLEARGFLAGVGKSILIVIVILVALGALIGFSVARRARGRR